MDKNFIPNSENRYTDHSSKLTGESKFYKFSTALTVMFCTLLLSFQSQAQLASNYAFSTSTGATLIDISSGATTMVGASVDDAPSGVFNIGFPFVFMGAAYSQFSASPDGFVRLGGTAAVSQFTNFTTSTTNLPKISPYWDDQATGLGGYVRYKTIGSAPNRQCVVEWFVTVPRNTAGSANATYQLVINESDNSFEFIYGSIPIVTSNYTIGFTNTATQFACVTSETNSVSYVTAFDSNNGAIAAGLKYSFLPTTTVNGGVSGLSFTNITPNSLTLNWQDASTNEVSFIVFRATDPSFTQNLQIFNQTTTSSATTGNPYTLNQTGLIPGTTYYYTIYAAVEGHLSSPLSGNETTLSGSTYYWVGAETGLWNDFANWNTQADGSGATPTAWATTDIHVLDGAGGVTGGNLNITVDRANFTIGQFLITNNTQVTLSSSITTTRTITISGGPGQDFLIEAGSSLSLNHAANAVAFALTGSSHTGLIAGSYTTDGSNANTFNTTGGSANQIVVASTAVVTSNQNSSAACITGNANSLLFENGSNWIHQVNLISTLNATVNYIPNATWQENATATLNGHVNGGNTTGTILTSLSPVLGNLIVNITSLNVTLSAFTTNQRTIQGNLTVNSTGTGLFRAVTSGTLTVNGQIIVNGGTLQIASAAGGSVIANGNIINNENGTIDVNLGTLVVNQNFENNGSVLSSETTTTSSRINFFGQTAPQIFNGTGTFTNRVSGIGVNNPNGLSVSAPILTQRVNLFSGDVTGSNNITIGTGAALAAVVEISQANNTINGGSFDVIPTFNLGTGTYSILYLDEPTARTIGNEIPNPRTVTNITINNLNGVVAAGGPIEISGTLTLTNGLVSSSLADHFVVGTDLAAATITGGSATSYLNGPVVRTINDANANSNFILYPVGKSGVYSPLWLAPATTSVAKFLGEAFTSNAGTVDPSISNLSATRRWEALPLTGTFDNIHVRLSETSLTSESIIAHAASAAGLYSGPFGAPSIFVSGTPNTIQSTIAVNSADYSGFLSFATSNACDGTPTPGATTATETVLCLGESTTLSITDVPTTSGIVYQWQRSLDGINFTDILSATNFVLTTTPDETYHYRCRVVCVATTDTAYSTPIQITFENSILTTTNDTICGTGTATLQVSASAGSNVSWHNQQVGGSTLALGNTFVTPTISETTTYFASANGSQLGSVQLGTASTVTSTTGITPYSSFYEGTRIQYLVRASELQDLGLNAGNITSMSFIVTAAGSFTQNNYRVKIGATTLTALPNNSFSAPEGEVTVFGPVAKPTPAVGIDQLNFTTPYNWDGTSNLIIEICHENDLDGTCFDCYGSNSTVRQTPTTFLSVFGRYADNVAMCETNNGFSASSSNRPNMIFNGNIVCASPRVPVVAVVNTPPALTLSSNNESVCDGGTTETIELLSNATDFDTYEWSPSAGVSGNPTSGWTFNPSVTTTYTLNATQTSGSLCNNSASVLVTVNFNPPVLAINVSSNSICNDDVATLTVVGSSPGQGQIGTGTTSNITSTPFKTNWGGVKTEAIYTAAELTAMGMIAGQQITSIGWIASNATTGANVFNNFSVSVGWISQNEIPSGFNGGANIEVFSTGTYALGATTLDMPINFVLPTPILWDGVSNLLVATCFNNNNFGSGTSVGVRSTTVPNNLNRQFTADNDPNVCSSTTSTNSTSRPNLRVSYSLPATFTWTPTANLYTDAAATIPYVAGANAPTVYYASSTATSENLLMTTTTTAGCTSISNTTMVVNENTFSSITETACGTYTAPDGTVYTTSGVYTAVIPNAAGCDSTITIDLTVIPYTQVILNPVICEGNTYLSPADNIYSTTGTYTEQVLPVDGCPVVFTINLTVNPSTSSETVVVDCDSYTWNGTTYTASGTYTLTGLTNANGCDSTATLVLTINNSFESTETVVACDSYEWSNGTVYTESGIYIQELQTVAGCDSTLTLMLTINSSNTGVDEATACDEFTWNGVTYTETGEYVQVLQNAAGCDSTVTLNLVINNSTSSTVTATACDSYTWSVNGATYTESGTYTVVLQNAAGCDSTITLELIINNFTVIAINNGNATLTATAGVSFQWVTCPSFAPIVGATNQLFTTEQNGNYAVIATDANGCVDTSSCVSIVNVGLEGFEENSIAIYPNPTEDFIIIDFTAATAKVEIMDAQGKLIRTLSIESGDQISLKNEHSAVYFVRIITDNATTIHRIVKQ